MSNIFDFADDLGPIKIVHIYDPKSGLKAVVAIDNVALRPGHRRECGWRPMRALEECLSPRPRHDASRLPPRACRTAEAKSVILGEPEGATPAPKEPIMLRRFAGMIRDLRRLHPRPRHGHRRGVHGLDTGRRSGDAAGLPADVGGSRSTKSAPPAAGCRHRVRGHSASMRNGR